MNKLLTLVPKSNFFTTSQYLPSLNISPLMVFEIGIFFDEVAFTE